MNGLGSRFGWRGALVLPAEYFDVELSGGKVKFWNGSTWIAKTMKAWNGTSWKAGMIKFWNGTGWELSKD